jgi:hypothetical protein
MHFPDIRNIEVDGATLSEVVAALDRRWPGLSDYLVDDRGALRPHVNLFVNEELLRDRNALSDAVGPDDRIHVMQALSGG